MEAARSLAPRRVEVTFSPQRTSSEILALAFRRLTEGEAVRPPHVGRGQAPREQGCVEANQAQEVTR
jgi:hypothetical protein